MKGITDKRVVDFLKTANYNVMYTDDGSVFVPLTADKDFYKDAFVFYDVSDDKWLDVNGFVDFGDISAQKRAQLLLYVNKYNKEHRLPKATLEGCIVKVRQEFLLDEEVSDGYILENCIKMITGGVWRFFCDLQKELGRI